MDKWVIVAKERGGRPKPRLERRGEEPTTCFFCPGNEQLTPPASLVYLKKGGQVIKLRDGDGERVKDWSVRCFANKYPALRPQVEPFYIEGKWLKSLAAKGFHEVVVDTPAHGEELNVIGEEQLGLSFMACFERALYYLSHDFAKHVCIFKNSGAAAGASIPHPHTQLASLPLVPSEVLEEVESLRQLYFKNKECFICKLVEEEGCSERRVYENGEYLILAPWASLYPYELWIIPKSHSPTPFHMVETSRLAAAVKKAFAALFNVLGEIPYNYVFKLPPAEGDQSFYHWRIEIYPRLSIHAGFEFSTGVVINSTPPEEAARALRGALM